MQIELACFHGNGNNSNGMVVTRASRRQKVEITHGSLNLMTQRIEILSCGGCTRFMG